MEQIGVLKVDVGLEMKQKLQKLAKRRYRGAKTISELARIAISDFLEEAKKELEKAEMEGGV